MRQKVQPSGLVPNPGAGLPPTCRGLALAQLPTSGTRVPPGGRQSIRTGSVGLSKRPALMRRSEGLLGAGGTGLGQA